MKTLSDKINNRNERILLDEKWLYVKDVKEFIKEREDDLHSINNGSMSPAMALARLRNRAGPKLTEVKNAIQK